MMRGWTQEHDEIVSEYVRSHTTETPKQMTVALFHKLKCEFDIDYVLKQVIYWRHYM